AALDQLMREDAFSLRLEEIWNDVLLTNKYVGDGFRLVSDDDFPSKYWWNPENVPWPQLDAPHERERVLSDAALSREPLALISYLVRNDLPFTGIVTAPYTVMNPYSARVYGFDPRQMGFH